MDILYGAVMTSMNIIKLNIMPHNNNLIGFSNKKMLVEGTIRLRVTLRTWPTIINMDVDFLIVNAPNNAYNGILGRMLLNKAMMIILTPYLLIKFPMLNGICQV